MRTSGWGIDEVMEYFALIGAEGRQIYINVNVQGRDVIVPFFGCLFFSLLLMRIYPNSIKSLVPWVQFLFDMLENVCIYELLVLYPDRKKMEFWVALGSLFTVFKAYSL